jgi:hypothetical protein
MGATDIPLALTEMVGSALVRVAVGRVDELEGWDEVDEDVDVVLTGEKWDMADPGRAGRFFVAIVAFFWAIMVSLRLGLLGPMVLFDSPRPGRADSTFWVGLGLLGSLFSSFWAVPSRSAMMALALAGQIPQKAQ